MIAPGLATEWLSDDFGYSIRVRSTLLERTTPYQRLEVLDTPQLGHVLRLDGALQCSEADEFFYHEPLVHVPAMLHPAPRSALVVGGGDGGAAEELLKHPGIEQVHLVEIDGEVIEASRRHLQSVHRGLFDGAGGRRFSWEVADGLDYLQRSQQHFDLLVLDLTDPGGVSSALYSEDFYRLCASRLAQGGWLSLHVAAPWLQPQRAATIVNRLRAAFPAVHPFLANVPLSGGPWLMACCSDRAVQADPARIGQRCLDLRGPALRYYSAAVHAACMTLPPYLEDLLLPEASSPPA